MKVINECRIDFNYRLSPQSPIISETLFSNMVSTQVIKNRLDVRKYVNKRRSCYFDILTYKIIVRNVSIFTINNIFFKDIIPENTRFIKNSLAINTIQKRCINPTEGIFLGNLVSGSKVKITFKVLVLPICFSNDIRNYSSVEYDYVYNIEEPPIRVLKDSNIVETQCENKIFTQSSIGNLLKTPCCINKILYDRYRVTILETKVINNYKKDLCTLLVIGKIEYEMCYLSKCYKRLINDVFGFSECVAVPRGIIYSNVHNISGAIEYATSNILDKSTIFISTNLLLHY